MTAVVLPEMDHTTHSLVKSNPDTLVGSAYVEVALQGDGHQGEGAAGESNLK